MVVYLYCVIRGQTGYVVDDQEKTVTNKGQMADRLCRSIIFMESAGVRKCAALFGGKNSTRLLAAICPGAKICKGVPPIYR